jgi:hypothetical protein
MPRRPASKTDQGQDGTGQLGINDPPQRIYPDNPEQVKDCFINCTLCLLFNFVSFV